MILQSIYVFTCTYVCVYIYIYNCICICTYHEFNALFNFMAGFRPTVHNALSHAGGSQKWCSSTAPVMPACFRGRLNGCELTRPQWILWTRHHTMAAPKSVGFPQWRSMFFDGFSWFLPVSVQSCHLLGVPSWGAEKARPATWARASLAYTWFEHVWAMKFQQGVELDGVCLVVEVACSTLKKIFRQKMCCRAIE